MEVIGFLIIIDIYGQIIKPVLFFKAVVFKGLQMLHILFFDKLQI